MSRAQQLELEASQAFVRRLGGNWGPDDQAAHDARLAHDREYRIAWQRVQESWGALDRYADAPGIIAYRAEAIGLARRAGQTGALARAWRMRRWRLAAAAVVSVLALAIAWQLSPYGYGSGEYQTGIGEQRILELEDRSRIVLDAATRVQVRYSGSVRLVRLISGQAEFSVAKDPTRQFHVQAGDRTIVAVGTVFTVEYTDRTVHVAMMEGKVAVVTGSGGVVRAPINGPETPETSAAASSESLSPLSHHNRAGIELVAGEELRVGREGQSVLTSKGDLQAATAWREGKVILRSEPLGEAVSRMNRYSRLQLRLESPQLADKEISGVFEAGDTQGFVLALQRYLPDVTVESSGANTLILRQR